MKYGVRLTILFAFAAFTLDVSADILKCLDLKGKVIFTDDVNLCGNKVEPMSIDLPSSDDNEIEISKSAKRNFPEGYFVPSYSGFSLEASLEEVRSIYGDKFQKTSDVTYIKHVDSVDIYRISGEKVKANWMEFYFYNETLYRIEAYFHLNAFKAIGGSKGILDKLKKKMSSPHLTGNDVRQSSNYGQWVPWNHESYKWNFDDNYSSVILMSSDEHERGHIQLMINSYEEKVDADIRSYLSEKLK